MVMAARLSAGWISAEDLAEEGETEETADETAA
jgi:hypothetical protein